MAEETNLASIRRATLEDMVAIAAMEGEMSAFLASIDPSEPAIDVDSAVEILARCGFGDEPLFSSLIAEIGDETVGYAIYNFGFWAEKFQGMVLLTDLFVREAWRSRGIGRQLMHQLSLIGNEAGCELIVWHVWKKNDSARQFYEQLGAISGGDELQIMTLSI